MNESRNIDSRYIHLYILELFPECFVLVEKVVTVLEVEVVVQIMQSSQKKEKVQDQVLDTAVRLKAKCDIW